MADKNPPDDFDIIFVEQGRLACEGWYRVGRKTVNRWLDQRGKDRLIDLRAAYVTSLRKQGLWLTRSTVMVKTRAPAKAPPPPSFTVDTATEKALHPVAHLAAQHLRKPSAGGWAVSLRAAGGWCVGTRPRTSEEMIALAERKGFDLTAAVAIVASESTMAAEIIGKHLRLPNLSCPGNPAGGPRARGS